MSPTTQKDEQKQASRKAILASAAELMRAHGIDASSVTDVMGGAGLTVGGFYNHFKSKEHLFATAIRDTAGVMWKRLLGMSRGESPRERARAFVGRYASRSHRDNPVNGCLLPSTAAEIARTGEPYRGALGAELDGFADGLAEMLGGAKRRELALGVIAMIYGAVSLSRAVGGTPLSDEILTAAKRVAELVFDGADVSTTPAA